MLKSKVFAPLEMQSVANIDQGRLTSSDPTGYMRYALGPLRPAPKEGKGWLFAAGELAMEAQDLAKWDIAMIEQRVLKPASYRQMETETMLKNGLGTGYGLGVYVSQEAGHRRVSHTGEVSGFTAANDVYPDDAAAVVVLTNQDAASASGAIARAIAQALFAPPEDMAATQQARRIFEGFQHGTIERALFTSNANSYFSEQALRDFAGSLGPLGTPQEFKQTAQSLRGGMVYRRFQVKFPQHTLAVTTFTMPDGKLEQYLVMALE